MLTTTTSTIYSFLAGGGEMGERTRTYDWLATTLGTPDQWPTSLKTTVGMLLHSAFPMFLWWGDDLLCFYNDAYRPSLGDEGKHPALGKPGREVWPEIWDFVGPLVEQVRTTGEPVWFEDQLVPIYRNGRLEDVYWTFSYGPAYDDAGQIGGVLVVCTETTEAVRSRRELTEKRFRALVDQAPVAIALFRGPEFIIDLANEQVLRFWGRRREQVMGQPLFEALPEARGQGYEELLTGVYTTGQRFVANELSVTLERNGRLEQTYIDLAYEPYCEADGSISGITVMCVEVTEQVLARQKMKESEARFRTLIEEAPIATALLIGRDMQVNVANDTMIGYWGKSAAVIGKPLAEAVPELVGQPFLGLLDEVFTTGRIHHDKAARAEFEVDGVLGTYYYNYTYKPLRNAAGDIYGILITAIDVTAEVIGRRKLEESEAFAQNVFFTAPVANVVFVGDDMVVRMANDDMLAMWGHDASAVGQPFMEVLPELVETPLLARYRRVLATGEPYSVPEEKFNLIRYGKPYTGYYNYSYKALTNSSGERYGAISTAVEVTEQVLARHKVEESEARYRSLIDEAPVATALYVGPEFIIDVANEAMIRFYGKDQSMVGKPMGEVIGHSETDRAALQLLEHVFTTGQPFQASDAPANLTIDGVPGTYYFDISLKPLRNTAGEIYAILQTAVDVTQQVLDRQQVQEAKETLQGAIAVADMGTWQLDMTTGRATYDDKLKHLFGLAESFVDRDQLQNLIHEPDRARLEEAFMRAADPASEGYLDEEYTVISRQTGRHRIVRAQAKMYFNANGQPSKMIGIMRDITEQRQTQLALEQLVQQRTEELSAANEELMESNNLLIRSNDNLQKFAYVASHDLQEPLRKIQSFGDILKTQYADELGDGVDLLQRMQSAASRMSVLIRDLLNFSRISTQREANTPVPLNEVIGNVLLDLELAIADSNAKVEVGPLPTVQGDISQLGQLFQNLIENALKFRKPNVPPHITISSRLVVTADLPPNVKPSRPAAAYHCVNVVDNGIGFDPRYVDRIFQVFQRLHSRSSFVGTGIGLAICEKVATNHGGAITAHSQPDNGATFSVYLP